jgi:hypothetical protein
MNIGKLTCLWMTHIFLLLNFIFCGGTAVWTQGFVLAEQVLYHSCHTSGPFCSGYFGDGVSWAFCPSWPQTAILLVSASQVIRIIKVSHWCNSKSFRILLIFEIV